MPRDEKKTVPHATAESLEIVRAFLGERIPFNAYLGVRVDLLEHGRAVLSLPFKPEFIGDPSRPALHGGVISMLIDACGGAAVWSTTTLDDRVSTIDLRVDYLLPGKPEALVVEGNVVRVGNRVCVVSMRAYHPSDPQRTIADGKGVYNIRRARREDA